MAILDNEMVLAKAQAETSVAAHVCSNKAYYDFGAAGNAEGFRVVCTVGETVTSTGAATVQFIVQMDNDAAFGSPTTVYDSTAIGKATLVAGYKAVDVLLTRACERYVRVTFTIGTEVLATGTFNAWIDTKIQTNGIE